LRGKRRGGKEGGTGRNGAGLRKKGRGFLKPRKESCVSNFERDPFGGKGGKVVPFYYVINLGGTQRCRRRDHPEGEKKFTCRSLKSEYQRKTMASIR